MKIVSTDHTLWYVVCSAWWNSHGECAKFLFAFFFLSLLPLLLLPPPFFFSFWPVLLPSLPPFLLFILWGLTFFYFSFFVGPTPSLDLAKECWDYKECGICSHISCFVQSHASLQVLSWRWMLLWGLVKPIWVLVDPFSFSINMFLTTPCLIHAFRASFSFFEGFACACVYAFF